MNRLALACALLLLAMPPAAVVLLLRQHHAAEARDAADRALAAESYRLTAAIDAAEAAGDGPKAASLRERRHAVAAQLERRSREINAARR